MNNPPTQIDPRAPVMVTAQVLCREVLPDYMKPVPTPETLHEMLRRAGIKGVQANPRAAHGGGPIYYSRRAVILWLKSREPAPPREILVAVSPESPRQVAPRQARRGRRKLAI